MAIVSTETRFHKNRFIELFHLSDRNVILAGGKMPGQTAAMRRHSVSELKDGSREHLIELGYGIVPARGEAPDGYPLLLPKLDQQLARFNIDGNLNNLLILRFAEKDSFCELTGIRNFGAPRETPVRPGSLQGPFSGAVMNIVAQRISEIDQNKINTNAPPEELIRLIRYAIDMRVHQKDRVG